MKLTFNYKDATIDKIHDYEYNITFNLSNVRNKVLSENARIFIESVNLCEFFDDNTREQLNGHLELRCNAIGVDEWDSSYDQHGMTLIYKSPLTNYQSFTNPNPMFMYNYKINRYFFNSNIVFKINFFDRDGDNFETVKSSQKTVIQNTEYTNYQNKLAEIDNKENEIVQLKGVINRKESDQSLRETDQSNKQNLYLTALENLKNVVQAKRDRAQGLINDLSTNKGKWQEMLTTLSGTIENVINFLNEKNLNDYPYVREQSLLNAFIVKLKDYMNATFALNQIIHLLDEKYTKSNGKFVVDFVGTVSDPSLYIEPSLTETTLTYTTSGSALTGSVKIEYVQIRDKFFVVINDIIPATDFPSVGETIIIDSTQLTPLTTGGTTPDIRLNITSIENKSINTLYNEKGNLNTELTTLEGLLSYSNTQTLLSFNDLIKDRIKSMNMSFVIYDEIDDIEGTGNELKQTNYQRNMKCQFKRL